MLNSVAPPPNAPFSPESVVLYYCTYMVCIQGALPYYPMARNEPTDDVREELIQNDDGFCTLQVRTKRGDGTRDEDRVTATLGRNSLEAVEAQRPAMLEMVRETIEETREMQPGEDESTEDESTEDGPEDA